MKVFKKLILVGRPASGKSEFIDFMKHQDEAKRQEVFHIGSLTELDDFVWLWQKFEEDDIWQKTGHGRLFSKVDKHAYTITDGSLLDYCLERFNAEVPKQPTDGTIFIEFARGAGDGGYHYALSKLSDDVLKDAAILFIYASYEEAYRRNEARYKEKLKHSVLAHKVPDEDMIRFGKEIDWLDITGNQPKGYLSIRSHSIPFVTMNNEPELKEMSELALRYGDALRDLFTLYSKS